MTEAVAAPCQRPILSDQVKVAYLDRAKKTIRLIFLTGIDKGHNLEYDFSNADVDVRIRTGDVPIDAQTQGGKLISLSFPPGMEPATSNGAPVSHSTPAGSTPSEEKPKEEPKPAEQKPTPHHVDDGKWKIKLLKKEGTRALILTNKGKEEWFNFSGKAAEKIARLKEGQLVKLKFESSSTFNDINPVDENGEYDKAAWGSGGGKGEGGGFREDPVLAQIRNFSILNESVLDKAEDFVKFCIEKQIPEDEIGQKWKLVLSLAQIGSNVLYQDIESKFPYSRGQS